MTRGVRDSGVPVFWVRTHTLKALKLSAIQSGRGYAGLFHLDAIPSVSCYRCSSSSGFFGKDQKPHMSNLNPVAFSRVSQYKLNSRIVGAWLITKRYCLVMWCMVHVCHACVHIYIYTHTHTCVRTYAHVRLLCGHKMTVMSIWCLLHPSAVKPS